MITMTKYDYLTTEEVYREACNMHPMSPEMAAEVLLRLGKSMREIDNLLEELSLLS